MTARNAREPGLSETTREEKVRAVVDDAHLNLASDALAEVLLAAQQTIATPDQPSHTQRGSERGGSPATHPYLRPIESLVHGQTRRTPTLSPPRRQALLAYIEDVAARPRGAAVPDMKAA